MATKTAAPKIAKTPKTRKSTTVMDNGMVILPELRAEDPGWGPEPLFLEQPDNRQLALMRSLSWYSANFGRKHAKEWLIAFATARGVTAGDLKILRSVHERQFDLQLGAMTRMAGRGLVLLDSELARIGDHLRALLESKVEEVSVAPAEETSKPKVDIQAIMRDKAREAAADLEGLFDQYVTDGNPDAANINVVGVLTQYSVMTQHVGLITEVWVKRKAEYEAVQAGTDKQLVEGYSQYTKVGFRGLVKWCDAVLAGLASYATVKKASKAPRKRKPVPVEKQVAKVKYLKTWKDEALKLELVSVHPAKLVGATEAFVYDTAKRRLTHYIADSHAGSLGVRGTTLIGFDATKSQTRTLRKPGVTLPALMKAGKPAARKVFAELTTVGTQPNGRVNENTVILRVA